MEGYRKQYEVQRVKPAYAESENDLICYFSYENDVSFEVDCTQTTHFWPIAPHQRHTILIKKSIRSCLNYLLVSLDIVPCIRFHIPPEVGYVIQSTAKSAIKKFRIRTYFLIAPVNYH